MMEFKSQNLLCAALARDLRAIFPESNARCINNQIQWVITLSEMFFQYSSFIILSVHSADAKHSCGNLTKNLRKYLAVFILMVLFSFAALLSFHLLPVGATVGRSR